MAQATAQQSAPAPSAPAQVPAPGGPAPVAAPTTGTGVVLKAPTTAAEVATLRSQRSELSDQLQSAAGRRESLAKELQRAPESSRPGIQARIDLLDARILQIEGDIAASGQLLISSEVTVPGGNSPSSQILNMDITPIFIVFTIFVLMPLAVTYARNMWRRGGTAKGDSQIERENSERLKRLETSVDTIAIEMERVSEGQRFVTKLLAESKDRVRVEAPRT